MFPLLGRAGNQGDVPSRFDHPRGILCDFQHVGVRAGGGGRRAAARSIPCDADHVHVSAGVHRRGDGVHRGAVGQRDAGAGVGDDRAGGVGAVCARDLRAAAGLLQRLFWGQLSAREAGPHRAAGLCGGGDGELGRGDVPRGGAALRYCEFIAGDATADRGDHRA